ncbi:MAG TPA: energy transducer TonB [Pyrinomonadaceae bacterium]|jgi:protein TonB|nr:energy transducer TonB [Pyrinomonadaceae bacterium]
MFNSLVESGSHRADLRRKGKFFLGATAFYAVLLAVTGVGSIYAYNASIEEANDLEVYAIMRFSPAEQRAEPARREEQRPAASNSREQQFATRTVISINTPYHTNSVAPEDAKDIGARTAVRIASYNSDAKVNGGPANPHYTGDPGPGDGNRVGPAVDDKDATTPPPPPRTAPAPAPPRETKPVPVSSGVLVGKAISKPAPLYPAIAKAAGAQGPVTVQVLIDENGRVLSAKATGGNPLLQQAAVQTAYKWKFTPTMLSGQPVKVTGVVTYNFTLNR